MEELGQTGQVGLGKRGSRQTSLVFFSSVCVMMFLFSLYGAQASVFQKARETLLDFAEPVLTLFNTPIRFVDNRIGEVQNYFNVLEQNAQLREENEELRVWMHEAITLRRQVAYFEQATNVTLPYMPQVIDAMVVGETGGPFHRSLILNAGVEQGIVDGAAVVNNNGLVGRVITTGKSASRVLMLTDFSSKMPVFIEGAEVEAILAGKASALPELEFFAIRDVEGLEPGMRVVTSGAGGQLPRGIPVGEIEVTDSIVRINLYSKYNKSDFVRVLDYRFIEAPLDETLTPTPETEEEITAASIGNG